MYATQTCDKRKLYYVEVEGARDVDYGWITSMSKTPENALKHVKKYCDQENIKIPWLKLKVTGKVLDSLSKVKGLHNGR